MSLFTILFVDLSYCYGQASTQSENLLVVDFRFGEQNSPLVQLLLAIFGGLAAIFVRFAAGFLGLFLLLRIEPNFLFPAFVS